MAGQPEMSREDFMAFIMDHMEKPRNKHTMDAPTVEVSGGNPGCGDMVTIFIKVGDDEKIEDISFVGDGCTISMAGASFVTSRLKGKKLAEVEEMEYDLIRDTFGRQVMATRPRCATLALGTTKAAIKKYREDAVRCTLDREHQGSDEAAGA
jgi:nitrogen fixation NifU-like protein